MPSGPVGLLINSLSKCHHPVFPTHALITFFRNKQAFSSNTLSYAFYIIWLPVLITSFRMDSWGLSLFLGVHTWCNNYKAYEINSQLAWEGSKQPPINCHMVTQAGVRFHLRNVHRGKLFFQHKGERQKGSGEAFLEHDNKAIVASGERWVMVSGSSLKIQKFQFIPKPHQQQLIHLLQLLTLEWTKWRILSAKDQARNQGVSSHSSSRSPLSLTKSSNHQNLYMEPPKFLWNGPIFLSRHHCLSNKNHHRISLGLWKRLLH